MKKKIVLGLVAVVAVAGGVAALSAYEAHVINVTAHIENALAVHGDPISFGTVFPQEYLERQFTVSLSSSFQEEDRVDDVAYAIKQKPKCECDTWGETDANCPEGQYAPVSYIDDSCPADYTAMLSLCPYLSKVSSDQNDTSHPSYFVPASIGPTGDPIPASCQTVTTVASGNLWKHDIADLSDLWIVDLKVPPIDGTVGQDWPAGCPVLPANDKDYGCDLWIEVTDISETPVSPTG